MNFTYKLDFRLNFVYDIDMGITKKQKAILEFIENYQRKNNISPSLEEIKKHFKLNAVSTVFGHIERLKKEGFIEKKWNSKRGIKIIKSEITKRIPCVGLVSAGMPIDVLEDKEYIDIPDFLLSNGEIFALKVSGNSMVDEGIYDGDYIILKKSTNLKDGDNVVALINGEATLKKYKRFGDKIKFIPANPSFKTIVAKEEDVKIQGVVIGLIRKY